jgi:hypothetical protein
VHFRERAAAIPKRLCATASVPSRHLDITPPFATKEEPAFLVVPDFDGRRCSVAQCRSSTRAVVPCQVGE